MLVRGTVFQAKNLLIGGKNSEIKCVIDILAALYELPVSSVTQRLLEKKPLN